MDIYLKEAFEELYKQDGLTVMGKGLGINRLLAKFIQLYCSKQMQKRLIFCVNCSNDMIDSISNTLFRDGLKPTELPTVLVLDCMF
jgi:hypothetical protein